MLHRCTWQLGGIIGRTAAASTRRHAKTSPQSTKKTHQRKLGMSSVAADKRTDKLSVATSDDVAQDKAPIIYASARPTYMSEKREQEVLHMAERMQGRDLTGDVPVASFALEIIKSHPSVRDMGLRERMDFLCTRWSKLSKKKRLEYLNDPLKGLL